MKLVVHLNLHFLLGLWATFLPYSIADDTSTDPSTNYSTNYSTDDYYSDTFISTIINTYNNHTANDMEPDYYLDNKTSYLSEVLQGLLPSDSHPMLRTLMNTKRIQEILLELVRLSAGEKATKEAIPYLNAVMEVAKGGDTMKIFGLKIHVKEMEQKDCYKIISKYGFCTMEVGVSAPMVTKQWRLMQIIGLFVMAPQRLCMCGPAQTSITCPDYVRIYETAINLDCSLFAGHPPR